MAAVLMNVYALPRCSHTNPAMVLAPNVQMLWQDV